MKGIIFTVVAKEVPKKWTSLFIRSLYMTIYVNVSCALKAKQNKITKLARLQ